MKAALVLLYGIVIALILVLVLTTCSSRPSLHGRWQQDGQDVLEFFSDGTFAETTQQGRTEIGIWRVNGSRLTMTALFSGDSRIVDFSISGDILILESNGESPLVFIRAR